MEDPEEEKVIGSTDPCFPWGALKHAPYNLTQPDSRCMGTCYEALAYWVVRVCNLYRDGSARLLAFAGWRTDALLLAQCIDR